MTSRSSHAPKCHKLVVVKVNAYVDKGISNLVELLNRFKNISTFESCEGGDGKLAYVYMEYGECDNEYDDSERFEEMAHFVNRLAISFAKRTRESPSSRGFLANISIEWWGDKRFPFISIEMPHDYIQEITDLLSCVQPESG